VLLAMPLGPLLSGILGSISEAIVDDQQLELGGVGIFVPGVRLAIWLAAVIIMSAGLLAAHSLAAADGRSARQVFRPGGNGKGNGSDAEPSTADAAPAARAEQDSEDAAEAGDADDTGEVDRPEDGKAS
jgi:hypothetical protein